ncbi:hypothetical protein Emag_000279 [Eimeria magna]
MEIPTFQSVSDECIGMAEALYNSRHDTPRMVALGCLLTSLLAAFSFSCCMGVVITEGLSSVLIFLTLGQLLLSLLLVTAELPKVIPVQGLETCVEGRFGFVANAFSRAFLYVYLGLSCIPLGRLALLCYFAGPLMLAAGALTIIFRQRQTPPQGEVLPHF